MELSRLSARQTRRQARLSRTTSLPAEECEGSEGSVVAPTDRPATGLVRVRRSVLADTEQEMETGEVGFINQFPYKSCQRSQQTPRKVTGHKWPHNKSPSNVPQRRVSLKRKAYTGKLEEPNFDHIPSASRPSSPDTQLEIMRRQEKREELSASESQIYDKYIMEELKEENIEIMSKELLDKIK